MQPIINIATRAARRAGDLIVRYLDRLDTLTVTKKSSHDFVTEVDQLAEREIIAILNKAYPDYGVLAEESGEKSGTDEFQWVIDPLDGTTNFTKGIPHLAVSIALVRGNVTEHAVIYDPVRQELFTASRGTGAYANDRRMRVSRARSLEDTVIGTGFPFRDRAITKSYTRGFNAVFEQCADIRRAGAAALDLAYVAAGRLDGFWEFGLKPWDLAAGALLIKEAGGVITDHRGNDDYYKNGNIVTGGIKVHSALMQALTPHLPKN